MGPPPPLPELDDDDALELELEDAVEVLVAVDPAPPVPSLRPTSSSLRAPQAARSNTGASALRMRSTVSREM